MSETARSIQRVAVIGAGYFSQFHLYGWRSIPGINIMAVCDADANKAAQSAQQFGATRSTSSVDELLAIPGLDLLDIVTPPDSHNELIRKAVLRGIPTICQKPFAFQYSQALALTELAEQAKVPLIVHENFRFMPWYREMRRLLDEGLLGKLHNIAFRLRTGDGQGPDAYLARQPYFQQMPRLLVMETAVHFIDTFRYLCGEVTSVYAHLRRLNPKIAGEDAGHILFEFQDGLAGSFDGNRLNDHVADNPRRTLGEMWLEGEQGVLRLDGNAQLYFKPHLGTEKIHDYPRGSELQFGGGACGALQQHVVSSLRSGQTPENSARTYLRNLRIQEAVYASHLQGRRIEIDDFSPPDIAQTPFH